MDGKMLDDILNEVLAEYDRQGPAMLQSARIQAVAAHMKMVGETTFARELPEVPFPDRQRAALLVSVMVIRLWERLLDLPLDKP